MKNYYEILEVDKHATAKVIKGVYKLHIKENHPDLFQGEEKARAEERIKKLNEAYEVLSDENKRKAYDKLLEKEFESELNILREENQELKNMLEHEEEYTDNFSGRNSLEYSEAKFANRTTEYEPDENVTYENNQKYMNKLLKKEFVIKLVATICILIAVSVGIYRATGFNLFEILWKAVIATFR